MGWHLTVPAVMGWMVWTLFLAPISYPIMKNAIDRVRAHRRTAAKDANHAVPR
ncbi:MAG: hypothetical protein M5R36_02575 [Deltaproteobacteria bacterium]|nr:hypothetical protein [Deltaproteobacteria bacterium]